MIKLVAFDWNGTLLADTRAIFEGDNAVIKFLGMREASFKEFLDIFDIPVINYYIKLGADKNFLLKNSQAAEEAFHNYYKSRETNLRTRAHAKNLLEFLANRQIQSIIFSNHVDQRIIYQLERLKIKKYFKQVLANPKINVAFQKRSKQEKLQDYLKKNKLKPAEVLIVGDTVEEIQIAREIRSSVVSITHGNCSTKRLKAAKPDYLITNLLEVKNILKLNS